MVGVLPHERVVRVLGRLHRFSIVLTEGMSDESASALGAHGVFLPYVEDDRLSWLRWVARAEEFVCKLEDFCPITSDNRALYHMQHIFGRVAAEPALLLLCCVVVVPVASVDCSVQESAPVFLFCCV